MKHLYKLVFALANSDDFEVVHVAAVNTYEATDLGYPRFEDGTPKLIDSVNVEPICPIADIINIEVVVPEPEV